MCFALLLWTIFTVIAIKNKTYVKNMCYKFGKIFMCLLFNLSIFSIFMIIYSILMVYNLVITIDYAIYAEIWPNILEKVFVSNYTEYDLTVANSSSMEWKNNISLSS